MSLAPPYLPATGRISELTAVRVMRALNILDGSIDGNQFRRGLEVEREHADITGLDALVTGRIVLAHLHEKHNYYTLLDRYVEKK